MTLSEQLRSGTCDLHETSFLHEKYPLSILYCKLEREECEQGKWWSWRSSKVIGLEQGVDGKQLA